MAESFADYFGMHAGAEQMARVRMSEIMEPDAWDSGPLNERLEVPLYEVAAIEGLAAVLREDQSVVVVLRAPS
jgi:hypothetical protein